MQPITQIPTCLCILAGGLSSRMGQDKARLQLGSHTLLEHIKATASQLSLPVCIIDQDLVPRCGPLGGIYTALQTQSAQHFLFLSCDMPFVSAALLQQLLATLQPALEAVFVEEAGQVGFPWAGHRRILATVKQQLEAQQFSLQRLARQLAHERIQLPPAEAFQLLNVNTPEDWAKAQGIWEQLKRQP